MIENTRTRPPEKEFILSADRQKEANIASELLLIFLTLKTSCNFIPTDSLPKSAQEFHRELADMTKAGGEMPRDTWQHFRSEAQRANLSEFVTLADELANRGMVEHASKTKRADKPVTVVKSEDELERQRLSASRLLAFFHDSEIQVRFPGESSLADMQGQLKEVLQAGGEIDRTAFIKLHRFSQAHPDAQALKAFVNACDKSGLIEGKATVTR